jgi:hypothetical protein
VFGGDPVLVNTSSPPSAELVSLRTEFLALTKSIKSNAPPPLNLDDGSSLKKQIIKLSDGSVKIEIGEHNSKFDAQTGFTIFNHRLFIHIAKDGRVIDGKFQDANNTTGVSYFEFLKSAKDSEAEIRVLKLAIKNVTRLPLVSPDLTRQRKI